VRVFSSVPPLKAPSIYSAQFTDSGAQIVIIFDFYTDQGKITDYQWSCSKLFSFTGASFSTCSWLRSNQLVIQFGSSSSSSSLPSPGDLIVLKANKIRISCDETKYSCSQNYQNEQQTVTVSPPSNPISPSVYINMPAKASNCEDITIDASSSTGDG
jgi:hypothetical protein